jgi:hypothetical protein
MIPSSQAGGLHVPLRRKKPASHCVAVHALHVLLPAAQLCVPVPFATAQLREPDGLWQACEVTTAPQTSSLLGVQACAVTSAPQLAGAPAGVQLCAALGAGAAQNDAATVWPKLSTHVLVRVCVPLFGVHEQLPKRVCAPLFELKLHAAARDCTPAPPHTSVTEHALHAP